MPRLAAVHISQSGTTGLGRALQGRFQTGSAQKMMEINRELAAGLAIAVAKAQEEGRQERREPAATHALSNAILASENRYSNRDGYGLMDVEFLNKTVPYWRLINDGTTRFVGRYIRFLRSLRATAHYEGRSYGFPDPHNAGIRMKAQRVDKLGRVSLIDEYGRQRKRGANEHQTGRILRPIEAQNYIERGVRAYDPAEKARKLLIAAFSRPEG